MKKFNSQIGLFFLFIFLPFTSIFSQGTISGTIVDEASGETIIGGNVFLKSDGSIGTSTDFDGKYQLEVPAGTHTLLISYIGYPDTEIENVVVTDGKVTYQDAIISDKDGGVQIEEIVVKSTIIKTGENALLVTMLKADRFTDGIGVKEMQKLNISSADQAVAKVVGVSVADGSVVVRGLGDRYSTAQLNGASIPSANPYKNAVNLDLIPSSLLSNIITSKTFTPDQPGTFTGGNVNMETKNFPETRSLTFSLSSGFNTQSSFQNEFLSFEGGKTDWLGYDDGSRDLASQLTSESYEDALKRSAATKARTNDELAAQVEEVYDLLNPQFAPTTMTTPMNHGFGISYADQYSLGGDKALGLIFSANYSRKFSHYNGALRNYALLSTTSTRLQQNFNMDGTTSIESPTVGGMLGLSFKINPRNIISFNTLYNHSADKSARSFEGSYDTYQIIAPDKVYQFRELYWLEKNLINNMLIGEHSFGNKGAKLEWVGSYSEATQNEPDIRYFGNGLACDSDNPEDCVYSVQAPSEYNYPDHFFRDLKDIQYEGKVDVTLPFLAEQLGKGNKIKFGGMYSQKDRTFDERTYTVEERNAENYTGDATAYFDDANGGVIGVDNNGRNVIGHYIVDDTRPTNNYTGSEEITAAYGMVTLKPFDRLKIIGGARWEDASLPVISAGDTSVAERTSWLPSLNLVYELADKMNLRAAYSQTVARPNLRELAPFSNFDFRSGAFMVGNPELEITSITNLDLRWEWLRKPGELLAVSGYYKSFENPIILVNQGKSNPEFKYENTAEALVYGVELEFRKSLGFISPKLENFKWSNNFSYIHSEVDIEAEEVSRIREINPSASDKRTFFNQSPFLVNSNLTFSDEKSGIDAGLSFNVFGKRLVIVGQEGTPDIFEQARPQLDFTISKKFNDNMSLRLSAKNLINPTYQLSSEFLDQEFIYSEYTIGRTFSLSYSYTIR